MEFLQLLNDIKKRPNSYGLDDGYREYVAFFNGVNAATCGRLLEGFSEHLARKLGEGQNLYWALIVVRLGVVPREVRDINELRGSEEEKVVELLFRELEEFVANHVGEQNSRAPGFPR